MTRSRTLLVTALVAVALVVFVATRATSGDLPSLQSPTSVSPPAASGTTAFVFPASPDGDLRLLNPPNGFKQGTAKPDRPYTAAATIIYNAGTEPVQVTGWAPIETHGLDVTHVELVPNRDGLIGGGFFIAGFPPVIDKFDPAGLTPLPASVSPIGRVLAESDNGRGDSYFVVIAVQLKPNSTVGTAEGVTLEYTDHNGPNKLHVPIQFTLCLVNDDACPRH